MTEKNPRYLAAWCVDHPDHCTLTQLKLARTVLELSEDRARLDWLAENATLSRERGPESYVIRDGSGRVTKAGTLRAAIDAARKEQGE